MITYDEVRTDGRCDDYYTLTRTWTATDRCGNSYSETQVVTVQDTVAPTLAGVPADETVECDSVPPPAQPTSSDNCDPAPVITYDEVRTDGRCDDYYTLTRTWIATDRCGNSYSETQVVTVEDTTAPTLAGVPADETVECDSVPPPAQPTSSDNCDPAPVITYDEVRTDGRCDDYYTLTRTWIATDRCGNSYSETQIITVEDTTAPTLAGVPADETVECDSVPPPAQPTAADNCDPAPILVFDETKVDGNCPGNYTLYRTWTATDRCGNASSATQVVTVVDTTPPVIEVSDEELYCLWPPNHWYICFFHDDFNPTITDNCSEPIVWDFSGCISDQPDDAPDPLWPGWNGDGSTAEDCWLDPAGGAFCPRSERCGGGPTAQDGRHYSVEIIATDACGNSSAPAPIGNIHVPHDQSPHEKDCFNPTKVGCKKKEPLPCPRTR